MIIIPIILIAVILIWAIAVYNRLVTERLKVQTQWSQVDVVLKQRFDMIPNLVETVKGYASHERETLQAVIDARSGYVSARDVDEKLKANTELSGAISRLMAVAESYPELKANQNFLGLQQEITDMEEKIADYRQFYNDTVLRYNSQLMTFPNNIIAGLFRFKEEIFFKAEDSEKATVSVRF